MLTWKNPKKRTIKGGKSLAKGAIWQETFKIQGKNTRKRAEDLK